MVQFAAQCYFSSHKSLSVSFYSYICCVNLQVAVSVAKIFNMENVVYLNLFSPVRLTVAFLLQLVKDPQVFFLVKTLLTFLADLPNMLLDVLTKHGTNSHFM